MDRGVPGASEASLTSEPRSPAIRGRVLGGGGFIGNAGVTLLGSAVGAVLSIGNEVLAARFLGVAGYGTYALALMLARSSQALVLFGLPIAVMHFLPVQLSRRERRRAIGTIVGAIPIPLLISIGIAIAGWYGGDWIALHVLGQVGAGPFVRVLGCAVPFLALNDLLGFTTRAFGLALPHVLIANLVPQLCAAAILVTVVRLGGPPVEVAYAQLAGLAVGAAMGVAFVMHLVRTRIGPARPLLGLSSLYAFATPVFINAVMALAIGWTDLFLLGLLTTPDAVGAYRGCMQIVLGFELLWTALGAATAPIYTVLIAEDDRRSLQLTYATAVRLAILLGLPLLLLIVLNGGDLLRIMGPMFDIGGSALVVLACGQFVRIATSAAGVVLVMGGWQRLEAGNTAAAAGLNLVFNLLLIPSFGLLGAAFATAGSLIGLAIVRCLQLRRLLGLHTLDSVLPRAAAATVPLALTIWAASLLFGFGPGSGTLFLGLRLFVIGAACGTSLWLFCLNQQDRAMLLRLVLRRAAP
jgi:O-antigen/teichoic acid export membrane protein